MRGVSSYLNQETRDSCHGSLARSVFTVSHHLAKESPRNDGRMKDASKETLVRLHQTLDYQSPDQFERKQKMPSVA